MNKQVDGYRKYLYNGTERFFFFHWRRSCRSLAAEKTTGEIGLQCPAISTAKKATNSNRDTQLCVRLCNKLRQLATWKRLIDLLPTEREACTEQFE